MSGECDNCGEHTLDCRCGVNEWISIEVRLPRLKAESDSSEDVLCYDGTDFFVCHLEKFRENRYLWIIKSSGCGCCDDDKHPTHWMPLPVPPKVK